MSPVVTYPKSNRRLTPALAMLLIAGTCAHAQYTPARLPWSVELDGPAYYTTISPFTDAAKSFSEWYEFVGGPAKNASQLDQLYNYPILGATADAISNLKAYPGWKVTNPLDPSNTPVINYRVTWEDGAANGGSVIFLGKSLTNLTTTNLGNGHFKYTATLPWKYNADGQGSLTLRIDQTMLSSSNSTDFAVRNLSMVPEQYINPQTNTAPVYRSEFLRKASPFKILRFMDWQNANYGTLANLPYPDYQTDARQVTWSDRKLVDSFSRTTLKGTPYEEIITLANQFAQLDTKAVKDNQFKKDIWINIPERATPDYVAGLASMLKNNLDSQVNIYVEYSNELWNTNGSFQRWIRVLNDARSTAADPYVAFIQANINPAAAYPATDDGTDPNNGYRLIARQNARRLEQIATILRSELSSSRIIPVLGGQSGTPAYLQYGLEYLEKKKYPTGSPANPNLTDLIGSIAIAPYVGGDINEAEPHNTVLDPNLSPSQTPTLWANIDLNNTAQRESALSTIFSEMHAFLDSTVRNSIRTHKTLANKYGLTLDSYEAGQHLTAFNYKAVTGIIYQKDAQGNYILDGQGYRIAETNPDGTYKTTVGGDMNSELKQIANRDPRMAQVYAHLLSIWQSEGGAAFTQFALASPYNQFGSWGLLEDINQTSSAKWDYYLGLIAGDANLDGQCTFDDFMILEQNFGVTDSMWGHGDFNLDGIVDYNDFMIFRNRFENASPAQASMLEAFAVANVPEPGAGLLLAMGLALLRGRRPRSHASV